VGVLRIVIMPRMDEAQKNGRVLTWFKKTGDTVETDERIAEAMSEKITFDIVAPTSGTLRVLVDEEIDVPIGKPIAIVEEESDEKETLSKSVQEIEQELKNLGVTR
jgi:pyruvate/2-oxoglutarate dehydrogenase complex dihydrolipoamide acyltransferase (E2) component